MIDLENHVTAAAEITAAGDRLQHIDGAGVPASDGKTMPVLDPSTGSVIGSVPEATLADVDAAVAAARRTFEDGSWRRIPGTERQAILWRASELIAAEAEEIAQGESLSGGMPLAVARTMVTGAIEHLRYYAGAILRVQGKSAELVTPRGDFHGYTIKEPVGVAALIVPWNFPFSLCMIKLAPALAAGCSVVVKPAEQTPFGTLRLVEILEQAGVPAGVVNVVTGRGHVVGAGLSEHAGVDKVAFTGSTEVGMAVARAATGNLKRVTLELGDKSPVVVMPDADLEKAVPQIAQGVFFHSGQICIAGTRVYAHRSIAEELRERLAAHARDLRIGPALDAQTQLGPLISASQADRVASMIAAGISDGADVAAGGNRLDVSGNYVEPTVLVDPSAQSLVVREEIFGPVLTMLTFDDTEQVIRAANDSRYGLAAAIWTRDVGMAHKLAQEVRSGLVWVNCAFMAHTSFATGGYRESGWGYELGEQGLDAYLHAKTVFSALEV